MRDALAALAALDGQTLEGTAAEAAELLAIVNGQNVERSDDDGMFRIVPWVARDRVISTVDGEARDGHKSRNRRFDGAKTHVSIDPDSELIDEVVVTPANTHDADAVDDLLAGHADDEDKPTVFSDSAYAGADTLADLSDAGYTMHRSCPGIEPGRAVLQGRLQPRCRRRHGGLPSRSRRDDPLRVHALQPMSSTVVERATQGDDILFGGPGASCPGSASPTALFVAPPVDLACRPHLDALAGSEWSRGWTPVQLDCLPRAVDRAGGASMGHRLPLASTPHDEPARAPHRTVATRAWLL